LPVSPEGGTGWYKATAALRVGLGARATVPGYARLGGPPSAARDHPLWSCQRTVIGRTWAADIATTAAYVVVSER